MHSHSEIYLSFLFQTFDLSKHKLIHDGSLTWRINNRKQIELHVVLLESAMVLLQKQEDKLVLKLQGTQLVAGKDEGTKRHSPLLWLNNVLARNDATGIGFLFFLLIAVRSMIWKQNV